MNIKINCNILNEKHKCDTDQMYIMVHLHYRTDFPHVLSFLKNVFRTEIKCKSKTSYESLSLSLVFFVKFKVNRIHLNQQFCTRCSNAFYKRNVKNIEHLKMPL